MEGEASLHVLGSDESPEILLYFVAYAQVVTKIRIIFIEDKSGLKIYYKLYRHLP